MFTGGALDSQVTYSQYIENLINKQNNYLESLTSEQKAYINQRFDARGGEWFTHARECIRLEHLFDAQSPHFEPSTPENPENLEWIATQVLDDEPSWPDQEGLCPTISNKVEEDTDDDLPALVEASDSGKWSTDLETCVFHHSSPCLCHHPSEDDTVPD